MRLPNASSKLFRVLEAIYKRGGMTSEHIKNALPSVGESSVGHALGAAVSQGYAVVGNGVFRLTEECQGLFEDRFGAPAQSAREIVGPRYQPGFKPLSDKAKFWLAREEELRQISFKSGSAGYFVPYYN